MNKNRIQKTCSEKCSRDRAEVIQVLVHCGAKLNVENSSGETPLRLAIERNDFVVIDALLKAGVDINYQSLLTGESVLQAAAVRARAATVKLLVNQGADWKVLDYYGRTVLHKAAIGGNMEIIKFFYKYDTLPFISDSTGMHPLHLAAWHGHDEAVSWFLSKGVSTEIKDEKGWTPLHFAAEWDRVGAALVLLQASANVNSVDNEGYSALHWASYLGHNDMVRLLRSWGAE